MFDPYEKWLGIAADRLDDVVRQGTAAFDAHPARPPKDLRKKP